MKAAFGLRAVFFFAVFFAMRSPMKTPQCVEGEYHEMTTFPLCNPSISQHDRTICPQDPLQDALCHERRHPVAGAGYRGQYRYLLGLRSDAEATAAGAPAES